MMESPLVTMARLEPAIAAQVTALNAQLAAAHSSPTDLVVSLVIEAGDVVVGEVRAARAGSSEAAALSDPRADALLTALEVARRVGHRVAVVGYGGGRAAVIAPVEHMTRGYQVHRAVERFVAMAHANLPVSAETHAWRSSLPSSSASGAVDAFALARQQLEGTDAEHAVAVAVHEHVPASSLSAVENVWREAGLAGAAVAVGSALSSTSRMFAKAAVAASPAALVDLVGLGRATALGRSVLARAQEHLSALTAYQAAAIEHAHEDQRVVADAWLSSRVETTVSSTSGVTRRLVRETWLDPLVFDLAGNGELQTQKIDKGLLISSSTTTKTRTTNTTHDTQRSGGRGDVTERVFANIHAETVTTRRETRFAEWLGKDVGVLVLDRDNDGVQAHDLFGDSTVTGRAATTGFDDLRAFDDNHDGVIDHRDPVFARLKIWRDLDGDGHAGAGELFSLADAGIAAIRLGSVDTDDPTFRQRGTFQSVRAVELAGEIARLPASATHDADVMVHFGKDGGVAAAHVTGTAVLTGAALSTELQRRTALVARYRAELAALEVRGQQ